MGRVRLTPLPAMAAAALLCQGLGASDLLGAQGRPSSADTTAIELAGATWVRGVHRSGRIALQDQTVGFGLPSTGHPPRPRAETVVLSAALDALVDSANTEADCTSAPARRCVDVVLRIARPEAAADSATLLVHSLLVRRGEIVAHLLLLRQSAGTWAVERVLRIGFGYSATPSEARNVGTTVRRAPQHSSPRGERVQPPWPP